MKTLEAKSLVLLKHHLKALRLPTVRIPVFSTTRFG